MTSPEYPASAFPDLRTAIVTGAVSPRGIGRTVAHRLARDGWAVAVLDLGEDDAQRVAGEIAAEHGVQALGLGLTRE